MEETHVLVAEDDIPLLTALENALTRAGYQVTSARNGEEAVAVMTTKPFKLIILDIAMPRMNGHEVLQHMIDHNISIPTIVLSNLDQDEDIKLSRSLGAAEHYIKSETPLSTLLTRIRSMISRAANS